MYAKRRRRAIIYVRISRTTDESVSLKRQESDLRKLCELEGWDVVDVIQDDGKSGTKDRANANRALDMLRRDDADTLVVWAFDRWSRQGLRAVADLIDIVKESKRRVLFYAKKDGLRSDAQAWRIVASVLAEVAAMEAENTAARVLAARAEHLSKTRPEDQRFLGGKSPFGYRAIDNPHGPGKALAIDEYEAEIVREVARRLIGGEKLTEVTVWLDSEGVPTPQSAARRARQAGHPTDDLDRGTWRVTTVRNLWRSETLIGRTTRREPILDEHGEPMLDAEGNPRLVRRVVADERGLPITRWAPVLDAQTFNNLLRRLPSHGRVQPRRTASWLTSIALCEACGGKLYVQKRSRNGVAESYFRCAGGGNPLTPCPAPASVDVGRLERYIEAAFLAFATSVPELIREERVTAPDTVRELQDIAHAIDDTASAMRRDGADYVALVARLDELKAQRRELQARPSSVEVVVTPTGRSLADVWAELGDGLDARREYLAEVITRVHVARNPYATSRVPLDEQRVHIIWNRDHVAVADLDEGNSRGLGDPAKRREPAVTR